MHKVMIRFRIVKNGDIIETALDERLSFNDNFVMLREISDVELNRFEIYDPHKKIFLDRNIPLHSFGFNSFVLLHVFN